MDICFAAMCFYITTILFDYIRNSYLGVGDAVLQSRGLAVGLHLSVRCGVVFYIPKFCWQVNNDMWRVIVNSCNDPTSDLYLCHAFYYSALDTSGATNPVLIDPRGTEY